MFIKLESMNQIWKMVQDGGGFQMGKYDTENGEMIL
jgi:hypothetical protein